MIKIMRKVKKIIYNIHGIGHYIDNKIYVYKEFVNSCIPGIRKTKHNKNLSFTEKCL